MAEVVPCKNPFRSSIRPKSRRILLNLYGSYPTQSPKRQPCLPYLKQDCQELQTDLPFVTFGRH